MHHLHLLLAHEDRSIGAEAIHKLIEKYGYLFGKGRKTWHGLKGICKRTGLQ
jgi:hypothetical protein